MNLIQINTQLLIQATVFFLLLVNTQLINCNKTNHEVKVKVKGRTGSTSPWFNWKTHQVPPQAVASDKAELARSSSIPKGRGAKSQKADKPFSVKIVSTLTRLGDIDVKSLERQTFGIISGENPPDKILHGAVSVHGFVFEFIFDKGLEAIDAETYIKDNNPLWYEGNSTTTKTAEEVKEWMKKSIAEFNQGTYHIVDRNCMHFTKAFCDYLGGPKEPKKYSLQQKWLVHNRGVGNIMQELLHAAYDPDYGNTTSH